MDKLTIEFQNQFKGKLIYDESVFYNVDSHVKLHDETKGHPLSSAAACINVLGSLMFKPEELINFLNHFGLEIEMLYEFPTNANVGGRNYSDKGYVVFEWIGPQESPINEKGGGRGLQRTSVDAFVIAKIKGKITQLLIEWKFTEGKSRPLTLEKFSGFRGLERLRRYSEILVPLRNDFNAAVADYNKRARSFPLNLLAGMFGFKTKEGFKADEGASKAPEVKF